jgi:hypothetical protein
MESITDSVHQKAAAAFDIAKEEFEMWSERLATARQFEDFNELQNSGIFDDIIAQTRAKKYESVLVFIERQFNKRSPAVIMKQQKGLAEHSFRKEMHTAPPMMALRGELAEDCSQLSKDFAAFLSLSDHLWVVSRLVREADSGDAGAKNWQQSVEVLSWNIQELVKDGLSTYFSSYECVKKGKKGSFTELMELVTDDVIKRQEERVTGLVVSYLNGSSSNQSGSGNRIDGGGGAGSRGRAGGDGGSGNDSNSRSSGSSGSSGDSASVGPLKFVCLQEVTHRMKDALLEMAAEQGLYVHFSATPPPECALKCCAMTCIVVRKSDSEEVEWQEDVVVSFFNNGQTKRTRRFAACKVRMSTGSNATRALCICSTHVLHEYVKKRGKNKGKEGKEGKEGQDEGDGWVGRADSDPALRMDVCNELHILEAVRALEVLMCKGEGSDVLAVGDWNGQWHHPPEENVIIEAPTQAKTAGVYNMRNAFPADAATQFGRSLAIDGAVYMSLDNAAFRQASVKTRVGV